MRLYIRNTIKTSPAVYITANLRWSSGVAFRYERETCGLSCRSQGMSLEVTMRLKEEMDETPAASDCANLILCIPTANSVDVFFRLDFVCLALPRFV